MYKLKQLWRKPAFKGFILVAIVFILALTIRSANTPEDVAGTTPARSVELTTAAEVAGQQQVTLIGTVRAFTEADITTERAGRITSVNATLGNTVAAGQVIATVENAAEQAAVLQAQGSYDAALAASAQSGVGLEDAQTALRATRNSAINTFESAFATVEGALLSNIDSLLGNPDGPNPFLRFDGQGESALLVNGRVALRPRVVEWESRVNTVSLDSDIVAELRYADAQTQRVVDLLDDYIRVTSQSGDASLQATTASLVAKRSELLGVRNALQAAETSIDSARDNVRRAELGASGNQLSAADAQVTQALGSLRAAQANLAKTIFRSPISGTVNELDVQLGDFVGTFDRIAIVANNNALEIVTFVGDLERDQLVVGDEVLIDGVATGTITTIAPSIDSETRKTEVRIATDNQRISNGDTVRVTKTTDSDERLSRILLPLTAIKFEATDGFIMQVGDDGAVTQKSVVLGPVLGNRVEVITGLEIEESFIRDVRGLTPGTVVSIRN